MLLPRGPEGGIDAGQVDLVLARREVGDVVGECGCAVAIGEGEQVGARAPGERVRAGAAGEQVVAVAAIEIVVAADPEELVVAGAAVERIVAEFGRPGRREDVKANVVERRAGAVGPAEAISACARSITGANCGLLAAWTRN
jgi:hypothetical protein